jgi:hypothetical protein
MTKNNTKVQNLKSKKIKSKISIKSVNHSKTSSNKNNTKKDELKDESKEKSKKKVKAKKSIKKNDKELSKKEENKNKVTKKSTENKKENKKNKSDSDTEYETEDEDVNLSNIHKESGKIDFDKILEKCLKGKDLMSSSLNSNEKKKLNEEYEDSFGEILKFRGNMTKSDIESIDTIVYHNENNDGMFSAAVAYHYYSELFKNNSNKFNKIQLVPEKPKNLVKFLNPMEQERYKDKTILILDLSFSSEYLRELEKICKALYIIDDHAAENMQQTNKIFIGTNHAACANVFKFFYPKEKVPKLIKIIDISDSKLGLGKYTNYMNLVAVTIGHRFTHNKRVMKDPKLLVKELWKLCELENLSPLIVAGHYMDEVEESLKEQIAINAKPMNFQGFKIACLNYNSPALNKKVLRQINTNFEKKGTPIDFAVIFGYEFSSNGYSVTMADNHRANSTLNLGDLAKKLAKIGGHPKGGFGHSHSSHFYWPRNKQWDIWDLFDKKLI